MQTDSTRFKFVPKQIPGTSRFIVKVIEYDQNGKKKKRRSKKEQRRVRKLARKEKEVEDRTHIRLARPIDDSPFGRLVRRYGGHDDELPSGKVPDRTTPRRDSDARPIRRSPSSQASGSLRR